MAAAAVTSGFVALASEGVNFQDYFTNASPRLIRVMAGDKHVGNVKGVGIFETQCMVLIDLLDAQFWQRRDLAFDADTPYTLYDVTPIKTPRPAKPATLKRVRSDTVHSPTGEDNDDAYASKRPHKPVA